ncbi:MAG: hypothetical protein COA96_05935 [SAR86 cluster bacterium]|uniref:DUF3450 domain-containing protein n=1 Tax=SAR86 cluster bacterium TaxID=2030880 RepID=A0A2A5B4N1_9GAMM|nr:MAG: hypothetical protein COA96_05935 [SAR86 cluster bacterium]
MKNRRITSMSMTALAMLMTCIMGTAQAAEILVDSSVLDRAMDIIGTKHTESAATQENINRLANSASSLFEEFKRENDNLEALLVLNAGFRKSISIQEANIVALDESIAGVEIITREIPLLMEKMLSSIEQFIELDYPFQIDERTNRISFARAAIDNPDVSIAEKFRQVLVMYQTEAQYGRTNDTYADTINIGGSDRDVTIVRVGRVALMYQTTDRQVTGTWDNNARQWVELGAGEYRTSVQTAIRVASQLDAPRIIELPVMAPELAQ